MISINSRQNETASTHRYPAISIRTAVNHRIRSFRPNRIFPSINPSPKILSARRKLAADEKRRESIPRTVTSPHISTIKNKKKNEQTRRQDLYLARDHGRADKFGQSSPTIARGVRAESALLCAREGCGCGEVAYDLSP